MKRFQIRNFCSIRRGLFILFFTILFLLRLYKLGSHDFWYDEIFTISYAKYPWSNWNAPFYWIFLHFWIKLFGISEFSLRFPSLIFSFLSVILIFFLGRNLFNKRVGICAALIMGVSPFHLWYAQEARDYSMLLFFGLLSSLLFYKALRKGENRQWLLFILVSFLGIYTNYFYIFLFFTQFLYLVFLKKLRLKFKEVIVFLIIALSFSFYLPRFLSKFYYVWEGFWISEPQWNSLAITLENFILGYNGFPLLYFLSNMLTGLFFISVLAGVYKKKELRQNFAFCLFLFFVPISTAFVFSKVFFSVYLDRGLIIFSPYFYLILSLGIGFCKKPVRNLGLCVLIPLLFISDYRYFNNKIYPPLIHHRGAYIKKPIRPIAEFLKDNIGQEDILAFTNESIIPSLQFYTKGEFRFFYYFFDPGFPDGSWQRPIRESGNYLTFNRINNLKFKRLWVISSDWARDGRLDDNSQSVKTWLDTNFRLEFIKEFDGLWIFRYVRDNS